VIKLLIVDDSALVRKLLGKIFSAEGDFELKFSNNGRDALQVNAEFRPDVITLDIHMPEMGGLECLDRIMIERPCPVVMVSSLTAAGADATFEALRRGAVDFVAKPVRAISLGIDALGAELVSKVRNAAAIRLRPSLRLREPKEPAWSWSEPRPAGRPRWKHCWRHCRRIFPGRSWWLSICPPVSPAHWPAASTVSASCAWRR